MYRLSVLTAGLTLAAAVIAAPSTARADAIRTGFDSNTVPRNDDGSTSLVPLGFDANFYGVSSDQAYVNNNGNITFDAALSTYTPFDLTSTGRQIIAPYFADVDTRRHGDPAVYGMGTVDGRPAWGVTWENADYYSSDPAHGDQLNDFQVVLIDRSDTGQGNFDIEFNYDQIRWETGDASGGDRGLGGASARVGFSNGTGDPGTFFELEGSAENGAFLDENMVTGLVNNSLNSEQPGRYIFEARAGDIVTPEPPNGGDNGVIPEPATLALLGLGAMTMAGRRRPAH